MMYLFVRLFVNDLRNAQKIRTQEQMNTGHCSLRIQITESLPLMNGSHRNFGFFVDLWVILKK